MNEGMTIFQMIVSVFEAGIALANLIVIICFTKVEWKAQKEREKKEEDEHKRERELEIQQKRREIVYSRIIAGRLCEVVEEYFDSCLSLISEVENADHKSRVTLIEEMPGKFENKKRSFKNIILPTLQALNKKECAKVKKYLDDHQDIIIEAISQNRRFWHLEKSHIDRIRIDILSGLLQMDIEI